MALDCVGPAAADKDESLLSRLAAGELSAVGEAYDLYHAAVRAFATRLVGDPSAAEDLVHDVFVALPRAMQRFRGQASVKTFLISIAVNHARHHVRAASRQRKAIERLSREPGGTANRPDHHSERLHLARALTTALDSLSLEQRVAFVLCEVEDKTSREAAELLNVPEATVRTRLFHAKKKLRQRLERQGLR